MSWKEDVYTHGLRHRCRIETLFRLLPSLEGKRCLDLGCGNGAFSWLLRGKRARPVGIDISPEMVRLAAVDTPAVVGDACALPFRAQVFDLVFALEVTYFLDENSTAREIGRILKPGGLLVLTALSKAPSLDARRVYSWLQASYANGGRPYYDAETILVSYPGFDLIASDSFSIFFIEILQALLYRLRQGRRARPESFATHHPSRYRGIQLYRLGYPVLRVFFWMDGLLKRWGAHGHNDVYVLRLSEPGVAGRDCRIAGEH